MSTYQNGIMSLEELVRHVRTSEISSIEPVITRIVGVMNDEHSTAEDLKNIIEKDPPLTAKILKSANSVYYHHPSSIGDLEEAIIWIGFGAAAELALQHKVSELFRTPLSLGTYTRLALWKHSVAVANCMKLFYRKEFGKKCKSAYVVGLLHTIGIIIEDQFLHDPFKHILKTIEQEKVNLLEAERKVLGYHHGHLGAAVLEQWQFPSEIVEAIRAYQLSREVEPPTITLTNTLYLADQLCQQGDIGYQHSPGLGESEFVDYAHRLGIKEKALEYILHDVKEEIQRIEKQGWLF